MSLGDGGIEKSERKTEKAGRRKVLKDTQRKRIEEEYNVNEAEKEDTERMEKEKQKNLNLKSVINKK
jgi:hypothetical protein